MLDISFIRDNQDRVRQALRTRAPKFDFDAFLGLDAERRKLQTDLDALRALRNKKNDEVAALKKSKQDAAAAIAEMKEISSRIGALEGREAEIAQSFRDQLLVMPNVPHVSVQEGTDASGNVEVSKWGEPVKHAFKARDHQEIGALHGILDMARGAKLTGSAFSLFAGAGARLQRALINYMLDLHTSRHGYREYWPPYLVNRASMTGTGQVPKFEEDMYRLKDDDYFLIPTAEVPVTNIHRDETLSETQLPLKYTAYTPCFRREAGAYGKDTKGLTRVHQFDKVELVKFTRPEDSYAEHESLLKDAEAVLQGLGLPYRVLRLCSGDMGFSAAKCYDIEVWAAGLGRWLEVSSVSNFEDFQARRANIRFRRDSGKSEYVHTLNGSGVALPRVVIALLENYQDPDGSVRIPEGLRPYMGGLSVLKATA
ncbi:MAG: Serine--tRNA ligase [Candidatus Omnitrophica bacterium]|nr:Serine--tRNA ligase [Candidatus Omnitrophota bacterium]